MEKRNEISRAQALTKNGYVVYRAVGLVQKLWKKYVYGLNPDIYGAC